MADYIRQQIKEFLKDHSKREVRIKYKGPRMNSAYEWWRYRNPIRMLWTSFIVEITRKLPPCEFKNNLLRMIGVKIGKDVTISPDVVLDWLFPELIEIGDGTLIGADIWIACHSLLIDEIRLGRVKIGKQVMIGSFVCNEPPTTIGDRAVIGVYAYLNKDVPADTFMVGIPAKPKMDLKKINYLKEFNKRLK
jgi:acetyltransferase-like isoleucine patch superfamily enzyme|tara:strand:+ start:1109 stop:1684 length:576 start_codon:yes stop_codon:yes gene_type:complete